MKYARFGEKRDQMRGGTIDALRPIGCAILLLVCGLGRTGIAQLPQPAPSVPAILARFNAPAWQERERAFRELLALSNATDGSTWPVPAKMPDLIKRFPARAEEMTLALIKLLENETAARAMTSGTEQRSEYQADLIGAVASLRDPRALQALMANLETGGIAMRGVAALGPPALDLLANELRSGTNSARQAAALTLGRMIDPDDKNSQTLDTPTRARIKDALLFATHDEYFWVRIAAIDGLANSPGDDVTAALRRLAEEDPYTRPGLPGQPPIFFVRERARAALQKRSGRAPALAPVPAPSTEH